MFFILSSIGEVIVFKDFRHQFDRTVTEAFIDEIKKNSGQVIMAKLDNIKLYCPLSLHISFRQFFKKCERFFFSK